MLLKKSFLFKLLAVCAFALLGAACGSSADEGSTPATTETEADETSSEDASEATDDVASSSTGTATGIDVAQWSDNVEITVSDGSFRYVSNGLPSHELPDQFLIPNDGNMPPFDGDDISAEFYIADTAELITESPLDVEITTNPVYSEEVTLTSLSTIGVMISGVPLFNDYEDQGREFVALDDNLELDGVFFIDSCSGHPLASGASYHYHGVPYCVTDAVDVAGDHSTIIGVLLDGFPIYGPKDAGGEVITSADLDECSGHVGPTPEFPEGIYHYHLTEDMAPYSIDCFHGEIDYGGDTGQGGPPPDGEDGERGPPPDGADGERPPPGAEDDAAAGAPAGEEAGEVAAGDADEAAIRTQVLNDAQWADNVTIEVEGDTVRFISDGLPSHEYLDTYLADGRDGKYVAGGVESYDASFTFPVVPAMADSPAETGNGAIGVAISGAVFFDPFEGDGSDTVANDDNSVIDGVPFIDACGGHPLPNAVSYHYHGIPFCITDAVDTAGEHSVLIGYLFDGYPIYGPQDVGGEEPTDLDGCLGHTGSTPEFEGDTYHYHVTSSANYISECLSGVS